MTLTIVGLGPGDINDLTRRAWQTLSRASIVYLRTKHHPCVPHLPQSPTYHSFDDLYDTLDTFEAVYETIATRLIEAAQQGDVVYCVPGDPLVGESTVVKLRAIAPEAGVNLQLVHGLSFVEPTLGLLGYDILDGLQVFDGLLLASRHHPPINPDFPALLGQVYSRDVASDIKLTLMNEYPDEHPVQLIHGAGTEAARVEHLALYEIDRSPHISHLTSLFVPPLGDMAGFQQLQEIVAHLRAPEGCPWDREQTHQSLRPFLIEEAYEVLETIDDDDPAHLAEELGDLLLQVVLHVQIAIDEGEFYMSDVLRHISHKMVRRHPHVWGDVDVQGDPQKVLSNWEDIKQAEKAENGQEQRSILDGIPRHLPSLLVAMKYQDKAAKLGFDWPDISGVEAKVREEIAEIEQAATPEKKIEEIGDLMFVLVNWLRWLGNEDPESLLRETNAKFYRRFRYIEQMANKRGDKPLSEYTLEEMDALWDEAKANGL